MASPVSMLKPWHTLLLGALAGYLIARKTSFKVPVIG